MFLKVFMYQILLKSRPQKYKDEMKTMDEKQQTGTKLVYQCLEQQWSRQTAKNRQRIVLMKPILNSMPQ